MSQELNSKEKYLKIKIAGCCIGTVTNSVEMYKYIIRNYLISDGLTESKVFLIECRTYKELSLHLISNFGIKIKKCDNVTNIFETRKIGNSFLARVVDGSNKYIYYYNDNKNDIIDYIHSVFEFAVLSYIEEENIILHSSLVEIYGMGILFSGKSGAGKTTMALLSRKFGTSLIENEHVIINLSKKLFLQKTSRDIRVKKESINNTMNIIDYKNLSVSNGAETYKGVILIFLEFGENKFQKLGSIETINLMLKNLIITKRLSSNIINKLLGWVSSNNINAYLMQVKKGDYDYSLQTIKRIMEEIQNEKN